MKSTPSHCSIYTLCGSNCSIVWSRHWEESIKTAFIVVCHHASFFFNRNVFLLVLASKDEKCLWCLCFNDLELFLFLLFVVCITPCRISAFFSLFPGTTNLAAGRSTQCSKLILLMLEIEFSLFGTTRLGPWKFRLKLELYWSVLTIVLFFSLIPRFSILRNDSITIRRLKRTASNVGYTTMNRSITQNESDLMDDDLKIARFKAPIKIPMKFHFISQQPTRLHTPIVLTACCTACPSMAKSDSFISWIVIFHAVWGFVLIIIPSAN